MSAILQQVNHANCIVCNYIKMLWLNKSVVPIREKFDLTYSSFK